MTIIHRYITREIGRYFAIVVFVVVVIYLTVDFFEKIDNFMEVNLPLSSCLKFFVFKIPFIVAQIVPLGELLAVILAFGLMNKNNELLALKSGGISIYYMIKPVLVIGVIVSVLLFFFSELLVPLTVSKSNWIWANREGTAFSTQEKDIWIKDNRLMTHIKYVNPADQTIFGITISQLDANFDLVRRIDAEKGVYGQGHWTLYDIMEQRLNRETRNYSVEFHDQQVETFGFEPDDLKRVVKKSEEMNFIELLEYIRKIETEGYDATVYRVDLNAKLAFSLVCLIMAMVGSGLAVRRSMKDSLSVGIVYGIGIAFVYWIFYSFCISLGYGKILPPVIAAWVANVVFLGFGGLLLVTAE
ncbi:MAG: LPS export ABC transporter permease LptG [Desulfobacterales bacterium]|nr:LPS export ABC transporter permease LptG [Desulfobacterales bacterium]MDD4071182.1 LPS export ABC transporter permease LptG [Desulfobacterales bacterium]MDD4392190.1 LPS export ABC transporter permease LptG [Desulfobacterales bacterium]